MRERGDLPAATKDENGKVSVEGHPYQLIQGMIRHFNFSVEPFELIKGYGSTWDEAPSFGARLTGPALIERGDKLLVAGDKTAVDTDISFSVRSFESERKYDWTANIGFIPYDWEIGHPAEFFIEAYVPKEAFETLERAYLAGLTNRLSVGLKTTLWVHDFDWHTPQSDSVNWYLVPELTGKRSNMPKMETAQINSLSWKERPGRP